MDKKINVMAEGNKEVLIDSNEVKSMIESFNSVQEVRDLSGKMEGDILAFYVHLDSSFIEEELDEEVDELTYGFDDYEVSASVIEQAEYFCDALVDNLKEYIESRYKVDSFTTAYDLGRVSLQDGIGFTVTISFGEANHSKLYEIASSINTRESFY